MSDISEKKSLKDLLLKKSSSVLGLNGISRIFTAGIKIVISRLLGPVGLGIYELVLAITRLGSMVPQVGLHQTAVYFISKFRSEKKDATAYSVIRSGLVIVAFLSMISGLVIWLFRDAFTTVFFSDHQETWAVTACALLLPLLSIKNYTAFCYRGLKEVVAEVTINKLGFPFLLLAGIGICWSFGFSLGINLILKVAVVAAAILVAGGLTLLERYLWNPIHWMREKTVVRKMLIYTLPIWGNAMLTVGLAQIDRIFIGAFSTTKELGFYGASFTFAIAISFIMGSFTPISQPLISEAYSKQDFVRIQEIYRTIVDWTGYIIIPIVGAFFLFGESLLGLVFGDEFKAAYWVLCILAIAQSINALSGPAGNILLMTNLQKISLYSLLAGFISGVVLNLLLIPPFGALGAAIGTGLSIAIINFIRLYQIKVYLNIANRYINLLKTTLIIVCSGVLTYIFNMYVDYSLVAIGIYLVPIAVGYWFILGLKDMKFLRK